MPYCASRAQETGPHLFEFSPSGVTYEYYAMAIGARSQSAKTYLERHYEDFPECESIDERDTAANSKMLINVILHVQAHWIS